MRTDHKNFTRIYKIFSTFKTLCGKKTQKTQKEKREGFYQFVNYFKHLLKMPQTFDTTLQTYSSELFRVTLNVYVTENTE